MSHKAASCRWWALIELSATLVRFKIIDKAYGNYMADEYYYKLNPY